MRLSEITGDKALEVVADLIEPVSEIVTDTEVSELLRKDEKISACKRILKFHQSAVIEILAVLEGENPEDYKSKVNVLTLPRKLIDIINDRALMELFRLPSQKMEGESYGSASAPTAE